MIVARGTRRPAAPKGGDGPRRCADRQWWKAPASSSVIGTVIGLYVVREAFEILSEAREAKNAAHREGDEKQTLQ